MKSATDGLKRVAGVIDSLAVVPVVGKVSNDGDRNGGKEPLWENSAGNRVDGQDNLSDYYSFTSKEPEPARSVGLGFIYWNLKGETNSVGSSRRCQDETRPPQSGRSRSLVCLSQAA